MTEIECSSCGQKKPVENTYKLYVGLGNYQTICEECQNKPFKEVMKNLEKGKVYLPTEV